MFGIASTNTNTGASASAGLNTVGSSNSAPVFAFNTTSNF